MACGKDKTPTPTQKNGADLEAKERADNSCDCEYQFYSIEVSPPNGYNDYNVELNTYQNLCSGPGLCAKLWGAYSFLGYCPKVGACITNVGGQVDTTQWLPFNCFVALYDHFTVTTAVQAYNNTCGKANAQSYTIKYRIRCREVGINLPNCAEDHYKCE